MMIAGTERRRQGCSLQDGKQWGKILGDTVNLKIINFPVSFNECFGGLALFNGDPVAAAEYATITDITNTNFKIYMYANNAGTGYANANIFYLFLGAQQQWGASGYAVTFPIAFNVVYNVLSIPQTTASTSNAYWGRFYITALTKNGFNVSDTGAGSNRWIAIGSAQQQWGYSNSTEVTFPIAFRECYAVVSNAHSNTTGNTDHYHLLSWTSTGATFGYWNMSFYGTLYIALGVE